MNKRLKTTLLAAATFVAASSANATVVTSGLVGYYDFTSGALTNTATTYGSVETNLLGSLQNLTYGTGATSVVTSGGTADFQNTAGASIGGYLKLAVPYGAAAGTNALGGNFSISAWYKSDVSSTTRQMIFEGDTDYDASYSINNTVAGRGTFYADSTLAASTFSNASSGSNTVRTGWDNFVVTYQNLGTNTTVTGYLNGSVVGTITTATTANISDIGLVFGTYRTEDGRAFDGQMDDLAIYNKTLSGAEVLAINTSAVPEPSTYGLMGAGALAAVALVRRRRKVA